MKYQFNLTRPDPELDATLSRFQECRECKSWSGDVVTGEQVKIESRYESPRLIWRVYGVDYDSLEELLTAYLAGKGEL